MPHVRPLIESKSGYMRGAFWHPQDLAEALSDELAGVVYDTLIGTGLSGALVIPGLARELDKFWAIVRKPTDQSHSDKVIEGEIGALWLFVDDFTATGATRERVEAAVKKAGRRLRSGFDFGTFPRALESPIMVGAYYYENRKFEA